MVTQADDKVDAESGDIQTGDRLLDSLGVTAVSATQVEQSVLAQATQTQRAIPEEPTAEAAAAREDVLLRRIKAVERELRAVQGALDGIDAQNDGGNAEECTEQDPEQFQGEASTPEAPAPDPESPKAADLQRAGLAQRLEDLAAKRIQLQEALVALDKANPSKAVPEESDAVAILQDGGLEEELNAAAAGGLVETERDRLIRLGVLTPFDRLDGFERKKKVQSRPSGGPQSAAARTAGHASTSGRAARRVDEPYEKVVGQLRAAEANRPRTKLLDPSELPARERAVSRLDESFWHQAASGNTNPIKKRRRVTLKRSARKHSKMKRPHKRKRISKAAASDEEAASSGSEDGDEDGVTFESEESLSGEDSDDDSGDSDMEGEWDDADLDRYNQRLHRYWQQRKIAEMEREGSEGEEEDIEFDGGFRIPGDIYSRLFDYQKTGVKWLWELYTQRAGGIIGDEMGLGKTVQLAAFLAGLHHSKKFRATLVVCPATVLRQWLRELRAWYPQFRVAVLHDSQRSGHLQRPVKRKLVADISQDPAGILVTSYEQLRIQRELLLGVRWGCAILDEGHKIRNPDAEVTLVAKQLQTVHRIIMTGSPIQNRLTELWSLFDFVFPGKLGTLPVFQTQFALPIQVGGYSNASTVQVSTAYKCAVVLRDLIAPYLLRRRKADVALQLPKKTEQVLFCSLTDRQRELYRAFLSSKECEDILNDRKNALAGIDILRKMCNHPDLLQRAHWENAEDYGNVERSGKLIVAMKVLEHWKVGGHRVLFFTQTQQMLDIVERAVQNAGMTYHRMDGSTPVAARARLVDDFNTDERNFVFLLTTKVGGIGVNLTGADRVLVYDPDWNPSTDMQARERAWRIGQKKEVTVYRLITSGTIEEKVYHRQIYKQFLTNKVLRDPRQKRFFKAKDMSDLFQLSDPRSTGPETAQIFAGINSEIPLIEAGQVTALTTPSLVPADAGIAAAAVQEGMNEVADGSAAASAVQEADGPKEEGPDDATMLRDLFEGTGIMSAMDHSIIEGANDPEALSIDAQASRTARRAADALRRSRAEVQAAPVNVPTWTGRHGASGLIAPTPPRRFGTVVNPALQNLVKPGELGAQAGARPFSGAAAGTSGSVAPTSAALLAHLRARQQQASAAVARAPVEASSPQDEKAQALASRLVAFLSEQGGQAGSSQVVEQFADDVGPSEAALFRQVLQAVAKLKRGEQGKLWVLRPDFAETASEDVS